MLFSIRDDDTSYFTKPQQLKEAYSFIDNGCISLSVVPFTVPSHKDCVFPYGKDLEYKTYAISDNIELIQYLTEEQKKGNIEVLLHGYSHEYKMINGKWLPEMLWKEKKQIDFEIKDGKKTLEELLKCKIKVFVAPNNGIDENAIGACEDNEMDYSGIIQHSDRDLSIKYIANYVYRWFFRCRFGIAPGKCFEYGKHSEIYAYAPDSLERLKKEFNTCKRYGWPFVIYTHYWSLLEDKNEKLLIQDIYQYAIEHGATLVPLSKCFEKTKNI